MFFLHYVVISLMLAKVASVTDRVKCEQRFIKTDCILRKIKWFYSRNKDSCVQRLTCRNGFDHRLDCESLCFDPQHTTNELAMNLLKEIFEIVKTTKMRPKRTTVPTKLSTKTTLKTPSTSSVTEEISTIQSFTTSWQPESTTVPTEQITATTQESLSTSSVTMEILTSQSFTAMSTTRKEKGELLGEQEMETPRKLTTKSSLISNKNIRPQLDDNTATLEMNTPRKLTTKSRFISQKNRNKRTQLGYTKGM